MQMKSLMMQMKSVMQMKSLAVQMRNSHSVVQWCRWRIPTLWSSDVDEESLETSPFLVVEETSTLLAFLRAKVIVIISIIM